LQQRDVPVLNTLHWVDRCVRAFFEDLEERGLFNERTLVIVTSDHSPHPGATYRELVPRDDYRRLGRLPLIFVARDLTVLQDLDVDGFSSQVDLAPTILELLGVAAPPGFVGRSMIGRESERFRLGRYRDEFSYTSAKISFSETVAEDGESETLRNRAIRKWLHNQDARQPALLAHHSS
jgi:phosphoglycerol transferase MdoB-like AlkP superfamily enzyme